MAPPDITRISWLMIAILGFVWGASFLFVEVALRGITPFWLAAARISFAALLMTLIWARGDGRFLPKPAVPPGRPSCSSAR